MIDCLTDYIGLKRITDSEDPPISGVYVNDLPGITTGQFEKVREIDENDGTLEAWRTVEDRAIRGFERDIMHNLRKYYQNHQIISTGLTGLVEDDQLANHSASNLTGWLFDMRTYAQSLKLEFNDVRLNLQTAEDFTIYIYDANTGEELFSKLVTGVSGVNIVKILQSYAVYDHSQLFIGYDSVIPIRMLDSPRTPGFISSGSIASGSSIIPENIESNEVGIAVGYNIKCSIDEFVCSRMELFTEPYLYKLGLEFLRQSKNSDNFTRYNLLSTEEINELIEEYKMDYKDLLDSTFHDLKVPDDGICFICNKAISKKVLIP